MCQPQTLAKWDESLRPSILCAQIHLIDPVSESHAFVIALSSNTPQHSFEPR